MSPASYNKKLLSDIHKLLGQENKAYQWKLTEYLKTNVIFITKELSEYQLDILKINFFPSLRIYSQSKKIGNINYYFLWKTQKIRVNY